MELWGRLTAVNVVWYLFVGAKTVYFAGILLILWKLILLSTIQCITFAGVFQIYKKIMEHFQITTACVITRTDTLEEAKEKIRVHDSVFLEDLPSDERNELLKILLLYGQTGLLQHKIIRYYDTWFRTDTVSRFTGLFLQPFWNGNFQACCKKMF